MDHFHDYCWSSKCDYKFFTLPEIFHSLLHHPTHLRFTYTTNEFFNSKAKFPRKLISLMWNQQLLLTFPRIFIFRVGLLPFKCFAFQIKLPLTIPHHNTKFIIIFFQLESCVSALNFNVAKFMFIWKWIKSSEKEREKFWGFLGWLTKQRWWGQICFFLCRWGSKRKKKK